MSLFLKPLLATLLLFILPGRAVTKLVVNTASVAFDNETGTVHFTRTSSASFNSTVGPVLTLIKSASATDLYPGRETIFTLEVANRGSSTALDVTVFDTMPELLAYVPGSEMPPPDSVLAPVTGSSGRLLWALGTLVPGASRYMVFKARALDPGASSRTESNEAIAHWDEPTGRPGGAVKASVPVLVRATPSSTPTIEIRLVVQIFDVTGKLVKTLVDMKVPASVGLTRVGDGSGGVRLDGLAPMTITLSNGTVLTWDGRDDKGMRLPSGIYVVKATSTRSDGRWSADTSSFTMVRTQEKLIEEAILVPNPATESVWISLRLASTESYVDVKVYNVAGELVYHGSVPGTARSFRWDLRNRRGERVAAGLYAVVLDVADRLGGGNERKIIKLAVTGR